MFFRVKSSFLLIICSTFTINTTSKKQKLYKKTIDNGYAYLEKPTTTLKEAKCIQTFSLKKTDLPRGIAQISNENFVVYTAKGKIYCWKKNNKKNGYIRKILQGPKSNISHATALNETSFVSSTWDGTVCFWKQQENGAWEKPYKKLEQQEVIKKIAHNNNKIFLGLLYKKATHILKKNTKEATQKIAQKDKDLSQKLLEKKNKTKEIIWETEIKQHKTVPVNIIQHSQSKKFWDFKDDSEPTEWTNQESLSEGIISCNTNITKQVVELNNT